MTGETALQSSADGSSFSRFNIDRLPDILYDIIRKYFR